MKGKFSDIDRVFNSSDDFLGALFYGPNEYKIDKAYNNLFNSFGNNSKITFEAPELTADIILNQPEIFYNDINTISFESEKKIIKIDMTETDKSGCLGDYIISPTEKTFIVVKSGRIGPSSTLRKVFEKADNFIAIPFYENSESDSREFIKKRLLDNDCSITKEAESKLISISGNDSKMLNLNLDLLSLYLLKEDKKEINTENLEKVLLSDEPAEAQNFCNFVALGLTEDAFSCLNQLRLNGQQPIQLINNLSRFYQRIHLVALAVENGEKTTEAIKNLKPPVFFKEKSKFLKQTQLWGAAKTERALVILNEAEREVKKSPDLSKAIVNNVVLRLSVAAQK